MPEPSFRVSTLTPTPATTPCPLSPPLGLPHPPALRLEEHQVSQELSLSPDPFVPPLCHEGPQHPHPHQFFVVNVHGCPMWHPLAKARHPSSLNFPLANYLYQVNLAFPSVTPFRGTTHHKGTVFPSDHFQATTLGVCPLPVCTVAGSADPSPEAPFGFLLFSFQRSICYILCSHPTYIHACFEGTLIISDIYNFLDRCH